LAKLLTVMRALVAFGSCLFLPTVLAGSGTFEKPWRLGIVISVALVFIWVVLY
jgi:hypothetical protein